MLARPVIAYIHEHNVLLLQDTATILQNIGQFVSCNAPSR